MLATNNGVGGADIALFSDLIPSTSNYTIYSLGTLLLHDTGIHPYIHKDAGLWDATAERHRGAAALTIHTMGSLWSAVGGATQVAGESSDGSPGEDGTETDSGTPMYTQQVQQLYEATCIDGVTSLCVDCLDSDNSNPASVLGHITPTGFWARLLHKKHAGELV